MVAKLKSLPSVSTSPTSTGFDETALVTAAKAGDAGAFSELIQHYDRRVFRMAKQITQNDDDAEDVLQETFLKAYTHLDGKRGFNEASQAAFRPHRAAG
jgi:DNA-directed RNA polymerase specialized sigma24 family protein